MKKLLILAGALLIGLAVSAEETKDKTWFENTLKGLKSNISKKYKSTSVRTSAVAAVRGAEVAADNTKPYWKGGAAGKAAKKDDAERKEFAKAVESVLAGKTEEGTKALNDFLAKHPDSQFVPDVKEALSKLSADKAPAADPAAVPAKP